MRAVVCAIPRRPSTARPQPHRVRRFRRAGVAEDDLVEVFPGLERTLQIERIPRQVEQDQPDNLAAVRPELRRVTGALWGGTRSTDVSGRDGGAPSRATRFDACNSGAVGSTQTGTVSEAQDGSTVMRHVICGVAGGGGWAAGRLTQTLAQISSSDAAAAPGGAWLVTQTTRIVEHDISAISIPKKTVFMARELE